VAPVTRYARSGDLHIAYQTVGDGPIDLLVSPMQQAIVQRLLDMGTLPPEMRDMLERYGRGGAMSGVFFVVGRIVELVFWLFTGSIFSTLGGLLGALIFKKQTPPGVIDIPSA